MVSWDPQAPPPPPPPAAPKPAPARGLTVAVAVVALLIGGGVGYAIGHSGKSGGHPAAAASASSESSLSALPTLPTIAPPEPSIAESTAPPDLDPADFKIRLRIKSKQCFGDAGCNVTYQIDPTYVGPEDLSSGEWEVTYVVKGGEDGPQINTFTITDGQASFDDEELIQTASSATKLTVKVTSVQTSG